MNLLYQMNIINANKAKTQFIHFTMQFHKTEDLGGKILICFHYV